MSVSDSVGINTIDTILFDNTDSEPGIYGTAPEDGCNFIDILNVDSVVDKYTANDILNTDYSQQSHILPEKLAEFKNDDSLIEHILNEDYSDKEQSKTDKLITWEKIFFKKRSEYLLLKQMLVSSVKHLMESNLLKDREDEYILFATLNKLSNKGNLTKQIRDIGELAREIDRSPLSLSERSEGVGPGKKHKYYPHEEELLTEDRSGTVYRVWFSSGDGADPLSWSDVIELWRTSETFRDVFSESLRNMRSRIGGAFFFETPPLDRGTKDTAFEFIAAKATELDGKDANTEPFLEHIKHSIDGDTVSSFKNLDGSSELIVPRRPVEGTDESPFAHLGEWSMHADPEQVHRLWARVGEAAEESLSGEHTVWISTSGTGVAWLHVRLDRTPEYYIHEPFKSRARGTMDEGKVIDDSATVDERTSLVLAGVSVVEDGNLPTLKERYELIHDLIKFEIAVRIWHLDNKDFESKERPPNTVAGIKESRDYNVLMLQHQVRFAYMLDVINNNANRDIYLFMNKIIDAISENCCKTDQGKSNSWNNSDIIRYVLTERIRIYIITNLHITHNKTYLEIITSIVSDFITNGSYLVAIILYPDNRDVASEETTKMIKYINELNIAVPIGLDTLYIPLRTLNLAQGAEEEKKNMETVEAYINDIASNLSGPTKSDLHTATDKFVTALGEEVLKDKVFNDAEEMRRVDEVLNQIDSQSKQVLMDEEAVAVDTGDSNDDKLAAVEKELDKVAAVRGARKKSG